MVYMLMHSLLSVILFGGIGVMALTTGAGIMVGAGIVLTILGDIILAHGVAIMAVTGAAGMAAATGDTITIILTMVGVAEAVIAII